jgi:hypothetical protein
VKQKILCNKDPFEEFDLYYEQKLALPENSIEKHKPALN